MTGKTHHMIEYRIYPDQE